jgi:hypothetical protein
MSVTVIDTSKFKSSAVTRKIDKAIEEGETLILEFRGGKEVSQARVLRVLKASSYNNRINLVIRDASLKEYVKNTIAGTLIGGATGVLAYLLPKLQAILFRSGPVAPVSLLAVLVALGIGAAIGGILAVCLTPVAELTIYRINGSQRIKIQPAS